MLKPPRDVLPDCMIPGKTFVLGEYLVLDNRPCLVLTRPPCFRFTQIEGQNAYLPLPAGSPAVRWLVQQGFSEDSAKKVLYCHDPYAPGGGFGASTAQFIAAYAWTYAGTQNRHFSALPSDWAGLKVLLAAYQETAYQGRGQIPSGMDLLAQASTVNASKPCLVFIDKSTGCLNLQPWPFEDLSYVIIRTGQKLKTHEHLAGLSSQTFLQLPDLSRQAYQALLERDRIGFIETVIDFGRALSKAGLVAPATATMLDSVRACPGVYAAKGCGAMGVDVIFLLCAPQAKARLAAQFSDQCL